MGFKVVNKDGVPFLYFPDVEEPKRRAVKHRKQHRNEENTKILKSKPRAKQSSEDEGFWEPNTDLLTKKKNRKQKSKSKVSEGSDISLEEMLKSETETGKRANVKNLRKRIPNINENKNKNLVSNSDSTAEKYNNAKNNTVNLLKIMPKLNSSKLNPESLKSIFKKYALNQLNISGKGENFTLNAEKRDKTSITVKTTLTTIKSTIPNEPTTGVTMKPEEQHLNKQLSDELTSETEESMLASLQSKEDKSDKSIINVSTSSSDSAERAFRTSDLRKHLNRDTRENTIDDYADDKMADFRAEVKTSEDAIIGSFQNVKKEDSSIEQSVDLEDNVSYIER